MQVPSTQAITLLATTHCNPHILPPPLETFFRPHSAFEAASFLRSSLTRQQPQPGVVEIADAAEEDWSEALRRTAEAVARSVALQLAAMLLEPRVAQAAPVSVVPEQLNSDLLPERLAADKAWLEPGAALFAQVSRALQAYGRLLAGDRRCRAAHLTLPPPRRGPATGSDRVSLLDVAQRAEKGGFLGAAHFMEEFRRVAAQIRSAGAHGAARSAAAAGALMDEADEWHAALRQRLRLDDAANAAALQAVLDRLQGSAAEGQDPTVMEDTVMEEQAAGEQMPSQPTLLAEAAATSAPVAAMSRQEALAGAARLQMQLKAHTCIPLPYLLGLAVLIMMVGCAGATGGPVCIAWREERQDGCVPGGAAGGCAVVCVLYIARCGGAWSPHRCRFGGHAGLCLEQCRSRIAAPDWLTNRTLYWAVLQKACST